MSPELADSGFTVDTTVLRCHKGVVSTVEAFSAMYVREKLVKGQYYYQMVEGYRDAAGRVRHRTIISLGQNPTIEEALDEAKRLERRDRRRLKTLEHMFTDPATIPGCARRETDRLRLRLTRHPERRAALQEAAKRFSS